MRQSLELWRLAVSVVTLGELRYGAAAARWEQRRNETLDHELQRYVVLPIDLEVAERWASLRVRCERAGRRKEDNDLWVAATAMRFDLALATLDRDHLDIPGLRVLGAEGVEQTIPE